MWNRLYVNYTLIKLLKLKKKSNTFSGGRIWEDYCLRLAQEKVNKTPSQQMSQVWRHISVVLSMWEATGK
jgi:hypothetical protein